MKEVLLHHEVRGFALAEKRAAMANMYVILSRKWLGRLLFTFIFADNLDYGNIKKLIKEQTTPGKGKAISVPGHAADIAEDFEDQLLLVFYQEHERVSRFVKSKWYEINSRLGRFATVRRIASRYLIFMIRLNRTTTSSGPATKGWCRAHEEYRCRAKESCSD